MLRYCGHMAWVTLKVITQLISLGSCSSMPQHHQSSPNGICPKFGWNGMWGSHFRGINGTFASWSENVVELSFWIMKIKLGMLTGLDFPRSRKNFPFPGKKFPDQENFGKLLNPYQACLCNSKPPPPTLTHATMPWTGGEAYTYGDCLWNDRRVAAVKIRQHWHWNNSALYSRSPDIRPPKSRETVCRFTVAVPPPCYDVLMPTKRDPRAVANSTAAALI